MDYGEEHVDFTERDVDVGFPLGLNEESFNELEGNDEREEGKDSVSEASSCVCLIGDFGES